MLNEPAFPVQNAALWQAHGMSLRDYFAAKALQALLSDPNPFEDKGDGLAVEYAAAAYVYADAMMAARK